MALNLMWLVCRLIAWNHAKVYRRRGGGGAVRRSKEKTAPCQSWTHTKKLCSWFCHSFSGSAILSCLSWIASPTNTEEGKMRGCSSVGRASDRHVAGGRIFFSSVNFVCWLLFGVHSTPVLPPWHIKDPGHSAKSAGVRLHLNTHTPLTQQSRSGLTMPLSRHRVGTYIVLRDRRVVKCLLIYNHGMKLSCLDLEHRTGTPPTQGSISWCGKGFFSQSQLLVQSRIRCPYTPVRNHIHLHLCAR